MFEVTDAALGHLGKALSQTGAAPEEDSCFRMVVTEENSIGLAVRAPEPTDQTFEREGTVVLALPESLSETLSERVLDLGEEEQLVLLPKPS